MGNNVFMHSNYITNITQIEKLSQKTETKFKFHGDIMEWGEIKIDKDENKKSKNKKYGYVVKKPKSFLTLWEVKPKVATMSWLTQNLHLCFPDINLDGAHFKTADAAESDHTKQQDESDAFKVMQHEAECLRKAAADA